LLIEAIRYGNDPDVRKRLYDIAVGYAISQIIPAHVAEVRGRKIKLIEKTAKAVKERLTAEIQYWDFRSADLKQKETTGKTNAKLNSQMAARRAEELVARMQKRLAELETEKLIFAMPPVVVGGALVIPRGLAYKLLSKPDTFAADAAARREIELTAMKAVMDIKKSLGYMPKDVSAAKVHYDVESRIPLYKRDANGATLRFIEVKGRTSGADTVTVTKNEILMALAIVEVDEGKTQTVYLKKPFGEPPDFGADSVNYNIKELTDNKEVILKRD